MAGAFFCEATALANRRYLSWKGASHARTKSVTFHDHFSGHAKSYARHRPEYPDDLFSWLASVAPAREAAVDCATGNGQAARGLAKCFRRVLALDASFEQIANASGSGNVTFHVAAAESTALPDHSADLLTVAQALHWLDHARLFAEARRVLRPGAMFAAWGYSRFTAEEPILSISRDFLWAPLESFWPPERRMVETAYRTVEFPFEELTAPPFSIELDWTRQDLIHYAQTSSASKRYMAQGGGRLFSDLEERLQAVWPDEMRRTITMPIFMRAGRV